MSYNLFCTHHPSTTTFLVTCRCLSVHASMVFLRSIAWIGYSHTSSFIKLLTLVFGCPFFPIDHPVLLQQHLLHVLREPLSCPNHSHVHHHLSFKKQGGGHCRHYMPTSRVSHMTAPAGPLTCFNVCTSKICSLHAFCCSLLHLPIQTPSVQEERGHGLLVLLNLQIIHLDESDCETDLCLPAVATICPLNSNLSVGEMPTPCPLRTTAGTTAILKSSLGQIRKKLLKDANSSWQWNTSHRTSSFSLSLLLPTASSSLSSPILVFPQWLAPQPSLHSVPVSGCSK